MSRQKKPYDIAVAYRIYPKVAASAVPLAFGSDKLRLSEVCLRSFKESLEGLRAKIWVLLDACPPEYMDIFTNYFGWKDVTFLNLDGIGNQATFRRQIEILLDQQDSDLLYFAEDDYMYLPDQFHYMIDFLLSQRDVDFVSPYDHLDCYTLDLHREPKWLRVHGNRHWRTAGSTCLTFLTTRETLQETRSVFEKYKRRSFDCSLWLSLTKHRVFNPVFAVRSFYREPFCSRIILKSWLYCWPQILFGRRWKLWVPIPAVATHLDASALSPNVDWRALMQDELGLSGRTVWRHFVSATKTNS
jgi:hypothetical protein